MTKRSTPPVRRAMNRARLRIQPCGTVCLTNQRRFAVVASSRIASCKEEAHGRSYCMGNSERGTSDLHMKSPRTLRSALFTSGEVSAIGFALLVALPHASLGQVYGHATHSSPIVLSQDNKLIWVVNPSDDSVSVIRPEPYEVLTHEPLKLSAGRRGRRPRRPVCRSAKEGGSRFRSQSHRSVDARSRDT
jgi:hypothetical protein